MEDVQNNLEEHVQNSTEHLGEAPEHHIETGFMDGYGQ